MTIIFYCAVTVSAIFVIKLILTMIGVGELDGDIALDIDMETDGFSDGSFVLFTLDGLLAFLMVFFWSFLMFAEQFMLSYILSGLYALLLGATVFVLYAFVLSKMKKLETSPVKDVYPEIGQQGVMYLSTVGKKGKAKFSVEGKYIIYDVYTKTDDIITTGTKIIVIAREAEFIFIAPDQNL